MSQALTGWIDGPQSPERKGVYEVEWYQKPLDKLRQPEIWYNYWDGEKWLDGYQDINCATEDNVPLCMDYWYCSRWRGLTMEAALAVKMGTPLEQVLKGWYGPLVVGCEDDCSLD